MRIFLFVLLMWVAFGLVACQEQSKTEPTPPVHDAKATELDAQTPAAAPDQRPATQENVNEANKVQGKGEVFDLTSEDALALLNGRFLLTAFMNQTEGIAVPLADQWILDKVEEGVNNGRVFTFKSEEWILILQEPGPDAAGILYHAQIAGPDDFRYIAEIRADGSIAPAQ